MNTEQKRKLGQIQDFLYRAKLQFEAAAELAPEVTEERGWTAVGSPAYNATMAGLFAARCYECAGHLMAALALFDEFVKESQEENQ